MTHYEISRIAQPVSNPNRDKPKLSLGSLRRNPVAEPSKLTVVTEPAVAFIPNCDTLKLVEENILAVKGEPAPTPPKLPTKPAPAPLPFALTGTVSPFLPLGSALGGD
jgi:hypothetical protein